MIKKLNLTKENAFPRFMGICLGVFDDEIINVGRFFVLYYVAGMLAVYCSEKGFPYLLSNLAEWLTNFSVSKISPFVDSCSG